MAIKRSRTISLLLERQLLVRLEERGFSRKYSLLRLSLERVGEERWWGGIGLALTLKKGTPFVNPIVQVRSEQAASIFFTLTGTAPHPTRPALLTSPLGYLTRRKAYFEWPVLAGASDFNQNLDELAQDICNFGIPFMRAHSDYGSALTSYQGSDNLTPHIIRVYHEPILYSYRAGPMPRLPISRKNWRYFPTRMQHRPFLRNIWNLQRGLKKC